MAPRLQSHRHLLILQTRLLGRRVKELSPIVMNVADRPVDRIPVDVDVEDVHEDRDAGRTPVQERRLVDIAHHDDLSIGGRDDELLTTLAAALGIAKEVRDPEREDREDEGEKPEWP